jgi:hypothetical protein
MWVRKMTCQRSASIRTLGRVVLVMATGFAAVAIATAGPASAQTAQTGLDGTLTPERLEPVFAPTTVNFFGDIDIYNQKDRRAVYKRSDDVVQPQAGVIVRVAPAFSITLGGNYYHLTGTKFFPTQGRYEEHGPTALAGGTYYFAHNYSFNVIGGLAWNSIYETNVSSAGTVTDRRNMHGQFVSAGFDANYLYTSSRLSLFAHYLAYQDQESASIQSDGFARARYTDSFQRVSIGGEYYKRVQLGGVTLEPMARAALLYDPHLQKFYNDRTAVELGVGFNAPFGVNTLAFRTLWTEGRTDYRNLDFRISLYHHF